MLVKRRGITKVVLIASKKFLGKKEEMDFIKDVFLIFSEVLERL